MTEDNQGERVTEKNGLTPPIFRLDVEALMDFLQSDSIAISELPRRIVERYNENKERLVFQLEGEADFEGCHLAVYRNVTTRRQLSPWVGFYKPSGLTIRDAKSENQQFVGFVVVGDELFAHTGGQAAPVFERFIDLSFPIAVARRIAEPEVKRARSTQITGAALAADVNFRDPRRITRTESLENVWTALSGQVRPETLQNDALVAVFGRKKKMRLDISGSVKFGPRVESLEKLLKLIRWLLEISEAELPADDDWKILDSIKLLNSWKSKDLVENLRMALAKKLFIDRGFVNMALTNSDASLYANASSYVVTKGREEVLEIDQRPEVAAVVDAVDVQWDESGSLLTSIMIESRCPEYGPDAGTHGTLLEHLHGEMQFNGLTYFLLAGRWYRVDADYVQFVTEELVTLLG